MDPFIDFGPDDYMADFIYGFRREYIPSGGYDSGNRGKLSSEQRHLSGKPFDRRSLPGGNSTAVENFVPARSVWGNMQHFSA